jgi:DNA-directed RNA polymerase III subunit RPC8
VFVPKDSLQTDSEYNDEEGVWVWNYNGHPLSMDVGEEIIVRVVSVEFGKRKTPAESVGVDPVTGALVAPAEEKVNTLADLKPPMRVIGSIAEDGLGMASWWLENANASAAAGTGDGTPSAADPAASATAAADGTAAAAAPVDASTAMSS